MNILKNPHFEPRRCLYCQHLMEDGYESGFFQCHNHEVLVAFYYQQDNSLFYKIFMQKEDDYITQMMFNVKDNEFNLIRFPNDQHIRLEKQSLVTLNFLPEIYPDQFEDYLEKLLNMQVFA